MSQIATAVITGVAMLLGYKLIQKQAGRQAEAVKASARAARPQASHMQKDLGTLVWDDRSGVYRPRA